MTALIPHFLLPREYLLPRHQVQSLRALRVVPKRNPATCRFASSRTSKPRVLEKPTRFNPPSHGRRIKEHIPRHYGPELTQQQEAAQETRQYPNMMPPKGTFMHWFLTNRGIHTWITMGTLVLLASFVSWENWCRSTIFRERLPSKQQILAHPIDSFFQFVDAWKKYNYETSQRANEERYRGIDDAQKRASYRRAHGGGENQGMQFWPPFEEREGKVERPINEGQEKRKVKMWFGIW
ncbi:MAG: hypothetical protein Q9164_000565 [Protoblastenia rupestris]